MFLTFRVEFGGSHRQLPRRLKGFRETAAMRSFGAFGPEAIARMVEAMDAAFEQLQDTGEPDVVKERIANRIIAAARLGERDPARLLEAALRRAD
jgi:hypothetical protein